MFFRKSPEKFWDLISSMYAASSISDIKAYETKVQVIKSYLKSDNVVLDIGCATGTQCMDISAHVKHVTGIDISRKLLAIAEQRKVDRSVDNVDFLQTTLFNKCFQAGDFDVVMTFYVLHFFEDIDEVFEHVHDLLKPGGFFILETACMGEQNLFIRRLFRFLGVMGFIPLINMLTYPQLEQSLAKAGFSLVEKTRFSEAGGEYTLIAKKSTK